jgi:hypothetical protein
MTSALSDLKSCAARAGEGEVPPSVEVDFVSAHILSRVIPLLKMH